MKMSIAKVSPKIITKTNPNKTFPQDVRLGRSNISTVIIIMWFYNCQLLQFLNMLKLSDRDWKNKWIKKYCPFLMKKLNQDIETRIIEYSLYWKHAIWLPELFTPMIGKQHLENWLVGVTNRTNIEIATLLISSTMAINNTHSTNYTTHCIISSTEEITPIKMQEIP